MGVFDTIADALAGKVAQPGAASGSGPPLNQTGSNKAMTQLQSARQQMMDKMKALGLSSMPAGGEEQLDAMYSDHVKRFGAAADSMRK
jgi:hypothetical protein